jgi:hypothetical protein
VNFDLHNLTAFSPHFACCDSDGGQKWSGVATRGGVGCKGHEGIGKYVVWWQCLSTIGSDQFDVSCFVLVLFVSCGVVLSILYPMFSCCNNHCKAVWLSTSPSMKFRWGCSTPGDRQKKSTH